MNFLVAVALLVSSAAPKLASAPKPMKPPQATASASSPPALEQAGEVKEIELDEKRAKAVYRIRTTTSIAAVLEFPEPFAAAPACGDCSFITKAGAQGNGLFGLQVDEAGATIVIKPRLYPGLQSDGTNIPASDFVTTITVRLASLTITLQVELTEDKSKADARVRFVLPNRSSESKFVSDSIAKARSDMESKFASRVEAAASEQLLRNLLEPHECRSNSARQRDSDIVLEVKELCRFGKRVFARFTLENRGRTLFAVGDVAASVGDGKTFTSAEAQPLLTLQEVAFQQATEGVVAFDAAEDSKSFELRISERGGRGRAVTLRGFGF